MATIALAAGAGALCCCCTCWEGCIKPRVERSQTKAIEKFAPKALANSFVGLKRLRWSVGTHVFVSLDNFEIGNLDPYKSRRMLELERVEVKVNLCRAIGSKGKDIEISKVLVKGCRLTIENSLMSSNVDKLKKELKKQEEEKKKAEEEAESKDNGEGGDEVAGEKPKKGKDKDKSKKKGDTKVSLKLLDITNVKVVMTSTAQITAGAPEAPIPLPPIKVDDFSEKFGKVTPDKLIHAILDQILSKMQEGVLHLADGGGHCEIL